MLTNMKIKIRNAKGKFASKKTIIFIYSLLVMATLLIASLSQLVNQPTQSVKTVVLDTTSQIITTEKNAILDTLQNCESKNDQNAIAWEDYGTGKNRASFGAYMLKVGTIEDYTKGLTDFQAIALASDANQARQLAEQIIFNTPNGIENWKNCMIKYDLQPKVEFVEQLQQEQNQITLNQ